MGTILWANQARSHEWYRSGDRNDVTKGIFHRRRINDQWRMLAAKRAIAKELERIAPLKRKAA